MNKEIKRLRYEKPEAEYLQLSTPLNVLELFSYIDLEVDQLEEGEDLDILD